MEKQAEPANQTEFRLALLSYIDDNVHVIYSPALELYGYGNDELEARASFAIVLEEYLHYTAEEETLTDDLTKLGWQINLHSQQLSMPDWSRLIQANAQLKNVLTDKAFKKFDYTTRLPALV